MSSRHDFGLGSLVESTHSAGFPGVGRIIGSQVGKDSTAYEVEYHQDGVPQALTCHVDGSDLRQSKAIAVGTGDLLSFDLVSMVAEAHTKVFRRPMPETPDFDCTPSEQLMLLKLIKDEVQELQDAIEDGNRIEESDALCDILVTTIGYMLFKGLPIRALMHEIAVRSNMSKLDANGEPIVNEWGKTLKGPFYKEPDLAPILLAAGCPPEQLVP